MLHFAVCDDNPNEIALILAALNRYLAARPTLEVDISTFHLATQLLEALEDGICFDVYLLDIVMPGTDGIQAAEALRNRGAAGALIFFTSTPNYALDAFRVRALQYLLKPVGDAELFSALDEACALPRHPPVRWFPINAPQGVIQAPFWDICYVECIRHVLCFHLSDGRAITTKSIRVPFAVATAPLLEDSSFLQIHKSFILNMEHVNTLSASSFRMEDGAILPVPRNKFASVRKAYLEFLQRHT